MLPEEKLEQQLHHDPAPYFKMWRFAQWKLAVAQAKWENEERQVRLLTLRKMIKDGDW